MARQEGGSERDHSTPEGGEWRATGGGEEAETEMEDVGSKMRGDDIHLEKLGGKKDLGDDVLLTHDERETM